MLNQKTLEKYTKQNRLLPFDPLRGTDKRRTEVERHGVDEIEYLGKFYYREHTHNQREIWVKRTTERKGYYVSDGNIWDAGEIPTCEFHGEHTECNKIAKYETPLSGIIICDHPKCAELLAKMYFEPIYYVEDEDEETE